MRKRPETKAWGGVSVRESNVVQSDDLAHKWASGHYTSHMASVYPHTNVHINK